MSGRARSLRPTDLPALMTLDGRVFRNEAVTWDRLCRAHQPPSVVESAIEGIFSFALGRHTWVSVEGQRVRALVSGRRRGGHAIWEVNTFLATDEEPMAGPALLGQLTAAAQRAGAHRVILRVAEDSPAVGAALDAGFVPYAREQTFVREKPLTAAEARPPGFRSREDSDDEELFRLYCETVPAGRRAHEAATPEQWRALHERDGTRASREFVTAEDNGRLSAWLRVAREGKALRFMPMLLHSTRAADVDSLVAASLGSLSGGAEGPIVALVPEYIGGVGPALAAGGFVEDMTYVSLVCRVMREVEVAETAPALASAVVEASPAQPVSVASTTEAHS